MKLPAAYLATLLPHSSLAAAISLTAVYGLVCPWSYALFAIWKHASYLSSALGSGGKFTGFLLRSIFLSNQDINVYAASTVFITAGMSACTSAQAAVLSDWFKNAAAAQQLGFHRRYPRVLPAVCRLMSIPVLVFGPGIGIPAAVLMYGVRTVESATHALQLRKWSAWGTLACLAVLAVLALLALVLSIRQHKSGSSRMPVFLAGTTLLSVLLIEFSGAARVHALYDSSVTLDDHLFYPLIVLPELLQQLLTSIPTLMHRTAYAEQYRGWRTATWPWVQRAFPATADASLAAANGTAVQLPKGDGPKGTAGGSQAGSCDVADSDKTSVGGVAVVAYPSPFASSA